MDVCSRDEQSMAPLSPVRSQTNRAVPSVAKLGFLGVRLSYRSRLLHWLRATPPWPQPTNSYADPLLLISDLLYPFEDGDEAMENSTKTSVRPWVGDGQASRPQWLSSIAFEAHTSNLSG